MPADLAPDRAAFNCGAAFGSALRVSQLKAGNTIHAIAMKRYGLRGMPPVPRPPARAWMARKSNHLPATVRGAAGASGVGYFRSLAPD